jgi:hypothetical protein
VILLASPPRGEEQEEEEEPRGVRVRDFVDAFERAERDAHSDVNPSGACDLTRAESRLLEGKESARGWALGGIERAAPTTGAELKAEAARVLVDAGFGTPLAEGWLDPGWLTVLSTNAEAAAVEHVVEACVETFRVETSSSSSSSDGAAATAPATTKTAGVVVVAPYRPAFLRSQTRCLNARSRAFAVVSTDPAAFGGDVAKALDAAEAFLRTERGATSSVAAVVFGNPSPATGLLASPRLVSETYAWCDARVACHAIADETGALAAEASFLSSDDENDVCDGDTALRDVRDGVAWGRAAGFASSTSLWPKAASETRHAVASFGAAGGARRGKTTCFLISRNTALAKRVRSDPFAAALQGTLADGGVAARDAFGFHGALLHERRRFAVARFARLAVATGPPTNGKRKTPAAVAARADDGGLHVWVDLRPFLPGSGASDDEDDARWDAEAKLWDALANTFGVLVVPGSLCGAFEPGFFRVAVAGEEATLREGLERLELGIRSGNDAWRG